MKTSIWPKPAEEMSDLELLDYYCETCSVFIDPRLCPPKHSSIAATFCEGDSEGGIFRHVAARGLVWAVNDLGRDSRENKALVRAKLLARPTVGGADRGHYTGDPEIEQVASMIDRIQALQNLISKTRASDARQIRDLAEALQNLAQQLVDYYKLPGAMNEIAWFLIRPLREWGRRVSRCGISGISMLGEESRQASQNWNSWCESC